MRIAIVAFDTRGGVEPYVALGAGLRDTGHDAWLVAPEDAAGLAATAALPLRPLTGNVTDFVRASDGAAERGTVASQRLAVREMTARIAGWTKEALDGLAGADLATGGIGGMVVGLAPAGKLGIPFVPAHLQPVGAPTGAYPGVMLGTPGWLGSPGRRLGHHLTELALWMPFWRAMSSARRGLGLAGRARATDGQPVLYGFSRHVVPVPPGMPPRHVTGYWRMPPAPGWSPGVDLEAFLREPGPVVSIGFGSMVGADPRAMGDLVREAVHRSGVRAVLVAGGGGVAKAAAADDAIFAVDAVPYDWLFPRVAAAVHHGGAGTTGEAIRAGIPAVVVPFAVDQPFWGSRVHALGVGPEPIPRRRLTVERLARAISEALRDDVMRARAALLGARLREENGVAAAVAVYEGLAR